MIFHVLSKKYKSEISDIFVNLFYNQVNIPVAFT